MPFEPKPKDDQKRSLAWPALAAFAWSAQPASAQFQRGVPMHVHEPFFVFPDFVNLTVLGLHWHSLLALAILFVVVVASIHRRHAKDRHKERIRILGVGRGQSFMLLDVLVHAVWKGRAINEDRVNRAVEFAKSMTDMGYDETHIREAALKADRLITPLSFRWMRRALQMADRRRIFETALAVMLESGPLTGPDRAFLRCLIRALELEPDVIGDLHWVAPA